MKGVQVTLTIPATGRQVTFIACSTFEQVYKENDPFHREKLLLMLQLMKPKGLRLEIEESIPEENS
jgi:hypothetical protein